MKSPKNLQPVPFRTNGVANGDANDVTGTIFYPYPGVYPTLSIQKVAFFLYLTADGCEVAIGGQFSDDGINWSTADADFGIHEDYNGANPWISTPGRTNNAPLEFIPGVFEKRNNTTSDTNVANLRLFVRFGVFVRNSTGVADPRGGTFVLGVNVQSVESGTVAGRGVLCASGGSAVTLSTPVTAAALAADIDKFRATIEIESNTGVTMTLVRFESDDGITWGAAANIESSPSVYSAAGMTYGVSFAAITSALSKKWVRFGVKVVNSNTGDADYNSAVVSLRLDWRSP